MTSWLPGVGETRNATRTNDGASWSTKRQAGHEHSDGLPGMQTGVAVAAPPPRSGPGGATGAGFDRTSDATPIRVIDLTTTELVDHDYRPLLDRLEHECSTLLSAAQSEAEATRAQAIEEARRIMTDAHAERATVLKYTAERRALMYAEAESEIDRWFRELAEERQAVLNAAREGADRLACAILEEACVRARAQVDAAERDAQRILACPTTQAERARGEPSELQSTRVDPAHGAVPQPGMAGAPLAVSPAPPQAATSVGSPGAVLSWPREAPEPESTDEVAAQGADDERHFWEGQFPGYLVRPRPSITDLSWFVRDDVGRSTLDEPGVESMPVAASTTYVVKGRRRRRHVFGSRRR